MNPLENKFRLAVFDEFLDSFAQLPRDQQKKLNKLMRQFRANPTGASFNYEKITNFADKNLRSVRLDDTYRVIVLKPKKGNVYALLWVDHHDKAYAWAKNKRIEIHPETGSIQVLSSVPSEEVSAAVEAVPVPKKKAQPIFKSYSDEELVSVGIPEGYLPLVRELVSTEQLDAASSSLPSDMYEALFFLADGETIATVRQALGLEEKTEVVDVEDFEVALDNVGSMRHFALVTDDQELEAMLEAPLDKWRVFLHPSQRKLVTKNYNGPARVLGGAGTGKTVVAMHRAKHLATKVFTGENDRILFTTFTNNLAKDIQENLRKLCSPATQRRIEVVHLDKWVAGFLKREGYNNRIAYFKFGGVLAGLWDLALASRPDGFPEEFFREEWDYVVQPNGCASYEEYRSAKRVGRGKRLSRSQRKAIWPVFEEYRNALDAKGLRESIDAMRDAAGLLESKKSQSPYRAIIVDESQDMSTVAFRLLRRLIPVEQPNDLFLVGDGHQRIYRRKVVLSHAGVKIVGRSKKLYINYRTTDEIRKYAVALLENTTVDDLDGGTDTNSKYKSLFHGQAPTVKNFKTFKQEVAAIAEFAKDAELSQTCLVARTNALVEQYNEALQAAGIKTHKLKRSEAENGEAPGLRIATMHRVKGLEFDRLIIAGVNKGVVPLDFGDLKSEDGAVREEAEQRERSLFYVAVTRARRDVLITSHGKASPWL